MTMWEMYQAHLNPDTRTPQFVKRYRKAVKRERKRTGWDTMPLEWNDGDEVDMDRCEHCLSKDHDGVLLVQPGVISGHSSGDWVCGACDPRVADRITFLKLCDLVGV